MYVVAELVGAVLAAGLYRIVRPEDYGEELAGDEPASIKAKLLASSLVPKSWSRRSPLMV